MKFLLVLVISSISFKSFAQQRYNAALLDTLEQIAATSTPGRHFAKLYLNAIESTNKFAGKQPENVRRFVFGFESYFAPEFFSSNKKFISQLPLEICWQRYYTDTGLNELQYQFMGMNAHINGDMWRALKDKYSYDSIKKYKQPLLEFQQSLDVFFDSLYLTTNQYKNIRRLHFLTLGLDKLLIKKMILHWRIRQVRLALLWFTNPEKCARKERRLKNKMQQYDQLALRWVK